MAVVHTQSFYLNVDLKDSTGGTTTFKIDSPLDTLSLQDVKNAFASVTGQGASSSCLLCTSAGYAILGVESARTELINKVITDLN